MEYESSEGFWFMHKVSELVTAILHNGIEIETFDEYPLVWTGILIKMWKASFRSAI